MILMEIVTVRPRCEKEIGSHKTGWHQCGRAAKVFSDREIGGSPYRLYFCEQHRHSATHTDLKTDVRVIRIGEVVLE